MGLFKTLSDDLKVVDVIIVGGGSAGCVIAGRLTEAHPNLSILLIESGRDNYEDPICRSPGIYLAQLMPGSNAIINYLPKKSDATAGRDLPVSTGGMLGGGSSINIMQYSRAQKDDYDAWETPGWTTHDLYPFLKKFETYHDSIDRHHTHGSEGPIQVSDGTLVVPRVRDDIIQAAKAVGWSDTPDLQVFERNNAFAPSKKYISPDGKRSDAAHAYLHPRLRDGKHPNLHVLVESQVVRVLFDKDKRACGVEYRANPQFQAKDAPMPPLKHTVRAQKLVVLSTGACGTPTILERSGIGSADILTKAGIPVIQDLPGVGHNYQDHQAATYPFKTSMETHDSIDDLAFGRVSYAEAVKNKDPRLGWNGIDVAAKCRPTEELSLGPEYQAIWDRDFRDKPNRPLILIGTYNGIVVPPNTVDPGVYFTMLYTPAYPYSRGHIHITGSEIDDPLDFDLGFFNDAGGFDIKTHVWAYKRGREIMRRTSMYRGEPSLWHPAFPANSKAALVNLDINQKRDISNIKDLEYTAEDDKLIEEFVRSHAITMWHVLGTAKMAPREKLGVVDPELNVYGVKGLKVADLSIPPRNVAANTNGTALMIGEKAAHIIIGELTGKK